MEQPFFSIITVCYNAGNGLLRAIEELQAQTCSDIQYIIKDGGSTDGSFSEASALLREDSRAVLLSCADIGIYDAMNQALSYANGKYVYFLNCGDRFADSEVLADVKQYLEANTANDTVIYGDFLLRGEKILQPQKINRFYLYRRPLNHQSAFFSREIFERQGGFDISFKVRADHEIMLRAYMGGSNFLKLDRVICFYEGGGFSEREEQRAACANELIALRKRYFTDSERARYDRRIRFSFEKTRRFMRSKRAPRWLRSLYRRFANFYNSK